MTNPKVNLYIIMFNKSTLGFDVVSTEESQLAVPSFDITEETVVVDSLKRLFEDHVDLAAQFTQFILSDVYVKEKVLNIDYYCLIPYTAKTKIPHAITQENQKYYPSNLQKILRLL